MKNHFTQRPLWALLLLCLLSFSYQTAFSTVIEITTKDEYCIGDGEADIAITETVTGASFEFTLYKLPDATNPVIPIFTDVSSGTTLDQNIPGLTAANYRLVIKETVGSTTTTTMRDFTINNTYEALQYTTSQSVDCNGINLQVDVTSGAPSMYRLLNANGTADIIPAQTSNIFMNVAPGNYRVGVIDDCNTEKVIDVTVTNENTDLTIRFFNITFEDYYKTGTCDQVYYTPVIGGNIQYPLTVEVEVTHNAPTPIVTTYTHTYNDENDNFQFTLDYYNTADYSTTYKVTATDSCPQAYSNSKTIMHALDFEPFQANGLCGNRYLIARYFNGFGQDIDITFDSYPTGFDPADFNTTYVAGAYTASFDRNTDPQVVFGGDNNPLPYGDYSITVTDDCGNTRTETFTIEASLYNVRIRLGTGCGPDSGNLKMIIRATPTNNTQVDNITRVTVTTAPAAFETAYGPLPYDVSVNIGSDGTFGMQDLPEGDYTFSVESECGITYTPMVTVSGLDFTTPTYEITPGCGTFAVSTTQSSNAYRPVIKLQYYNEAEGVWEHPFNGGDGGFSLIYSTAGSESIAYREYTGTRDMLTKDGTYRFLYQSTIFTNGGGEAICDMDIVEFNYANRPQINDYYVFQCVDGTINVVVDAQGYAPLTYELISKDGDDTFYVDNAEDPVFVNLQPGNYTLKVTDDCPNSFQINIDATEVRLPIIRPFEICDGQNGGYLYLPGLSFLDIEWFKQPDLTTPIGTGNYLYFNPYTEATDNGTYVAKLSYSSGPTPACFNTEIDFTLTAGTSTMPNAGTGQTVDLTSADLNGNPYIDLFDYLTGPYDDYGTWSVDKDKALLANSLFYAQFAGVGTWTFTYSVNGTCSGTDEATVIVNIPIPLPIKLKAFDVTADNNDALINWTTASESNTSHFEIEYSLDGINFNKVTSVASQSKDGYSRTELNYTFTDANAASKGAVVYYRLKDVDLDGQFAYSDVQLVRFDGNTAANVYPNPVKVGNAITIESPELSSVAVYTMDGRLIQQFNWDNPVDRASIQLNNVAKGAYYLIINNGSDKEMVIVQ